MMAVKDLEVTPETQAQMNVLNELFMAQAAAAGVKLQLVHFALVVLPVGEDFKASKDINPAVIATMGRDAVALMHAAEMLRDVAYSAGYARTDISPLLTKMEKVLGLKSAEAGGAT